MKKQLKEFRGITLIALVITIIVLLILAGVSIAMLTGDNGILTKAQNAKKVTDIAEVKERAQLDIVNWTAERLKNGEDTTLGDETVKSIIENANEDNTNKYYSELTDTSIITKQGNEILLSDLYTKPSGGGILAKEVLQTDSTATEAEARSPYVKYNGLDCRVLYNDDIHGVQIITADSVETVTLGAEDEMVTSSDFTYDGTATVSDNFKKAAASYNNVVDNLNNKAKTYKDTEGIARDARCLGSIPTLTVTDSKFQGDTTTKMWSGRFNYLKTYSWNEKFKVDDENYSEDVSQLNNLELNASSGYTWLASRYVLTDSAYSTYFCVRNVYSSGGSSRDHLCSLNYDMPDRPSYREAADLGFRPVFLLSSDATIISGDGSSENPYIISK